MAGTKTGMTPSPLGSHRVVSESEWMQAAQALLVEEKELTHARERLAAKRRDLPWTKVEKEYVFETPRGKKSLADLFEGRSQLIVYHFMFGPEWEEGCHGCSLVSDSMNGNAVHVEQRDATYTAVSRGPLAKIEAFKKRMGWNFKWASSLGSDFNKDFRVSFTKEDLAAGKCYNLGTAGFGAEEAPGLSVFCKNPKGEIFRTYSSFGRGLEDFMTIYALLDRLPKGRDEAGLKSPMVWVRHHDRYESAKLVELK